MHPGSRQKSNVNSASSPAKYVAAFHCKSWFARTPNTQDLPLGSGFSLFYEERRLETMRPLDGLLKAISKPEPINLHVVDIENLAGSGKLTESLVRSIQCAYTSATKSTGDDLYLIAAGPQNKHVLFSGWSHGTAIYQFRKGKDGADMALVNLFSQIEHPEIFDHIFLASGDGGLSIIAERAEGLGAEVTVVTGAGAISWKYRGHKALQITSGF